MVKGLEALQDIRSKPFSWEKLKDSLDIIEKELKEAEENKAMLDIFKNAITIERQIPPELEIKESEKGSSYVFKEAVKIHENRIEEMLKKSLREWVLKNAIPNEFKTLEIIFEAPYIIDLLFRKGELGKEASERYMWGTISDKDVERVKEFFADGKRDQSK